MQQPQQAQRQAEQAVRQASPWLVSLGRLGYAAKGLVGVLALVGWAGRLAWS